MKTIPDSHHDITDAAGVTYVATVCPDGQISITPVSAMLHGDQVKFSTKKDRGKYRNLLADSRIAVCMQHPTDPFRYLEIRGRARIEDDDDRAFVNAIAVKFLGQEEYPHDKPGEERVVVIVDAEEVLGPGVPKS
jgi:PPOX class probable F420-dependent enzyme